jgi:hypothetical protein
MKFMSIVYASRESEKGEMPDPRLMAAIGQLGDEMLKNGTMLDTGGLAPSAAGKRVKVSGGKISITDGPFAESKEQLGGYYLIEVPDLDAALSWAARCPATNHGVVEVRPIWEMADLKT